MVSDNVYASIGRLWKGDALEALKNFVRLPAKSSDFEPDWESKGILKKALEDAAAWAKKQVPGIRTEIFEEKGVPPALFWRLPATTGRRGRTAFFYGHLDKQPELEGWSEGLSPWNPVIRGDLLYGRGAVDDGYNFYAVMSAVKALEENGVPHPEIAGLYETDEESGSKGLEAWIAEAAKRMGKPAFIAINDLDGQDPSRLWLTLSTRGVLAFTLTAKVLERPAHSGSAGGIVPSSFRIVRALLSRIEDEETGEILVPELRTEVPESILAAVRALSGKEDVRAHFEWAGKTHSEADTPYEAMLRNTWQSALSITAAAGLPPLSSASNLVRAYTSVRVSIRMPPNADGRKAFEHIRTLLTENVPCGAEVSITDADMYNGFAQQPPEGWIKDALSAASRRHFGGSEPGYLFCGASIGTLPNFRRQFPDSPFVNTGALSPSSHAHAPDENLSLSLCEKLACTAADLIAAVPEEE